MILKAYESSLNPLQHFVWQIETKGRMLFYVSPKLLVQFCEGLRHHNGVKRYFRVSQNPLPEGCRVVNTYYDRTAGLVAIILEHESFDRVERGTPCPVLPGPVLQTVYVEEE